jgi:uncharacterized protein Yka (UPF0111/DUF47 family)
MRTGECHDPDLLELAQETDRVADTLNDPVMRARLYEIAREVRELAILDAAWAGAIHS